MFIPLRVHSVYSKGKGGLTLEELASWVESKGLRKVALTDVENLYGWGRWKRVAVEIGFFPVFGCEMELQGKRFVFLVKEKEGYWNLVEILNRRSGGKTEGLITIFVPPPRGEVPPEEFSFGEDFYVGCDFFNFQNAQTWARKHGFPLVWVNPLKYIRSPERLILLHSIQKKIPFPPENDKLRSRVEVFGPAQERLALKKFGPLLKEALQQTFEVAEKCSFVFEGIVPPLPERLFPLSLREVVLEKLRRRRDLSWRERERARRELEVVEGSGFAPYFLIVHDVVEFARQRGILYNLKGSGASSFLAYLLGISHVNPMEFDLYFERFLNRGRSDPPDFDLDFDSRRRDEVLSYVLEKYNSQRTGAAYVCSLKNYRARSALYETARAFGVPPEEARSLCRRIPFFAEPHFLKKDTPPPGYERIWEAASQLSSVYCESSLHVGGVILTPSPLERYLPLEESAKGYRMSHFDREAVEDLKLIKLDLLSVRGLAAISETCQRLRLHRIPAGDEKAYELLKKGLTIGCFQVESPAMMNLLRRMKPENIHELTQALALIRPGPTESGMKEAFLRAREGRPISHSPLMKRVLPETSGLLIYEEQVMQIVERVAGVSPDEGDLLRRELRLQKKNFPLKENFFREARERGYTLEEVRRLWRTMEKFSSYSFNKAHSASYASMAYRAVYLKAHYPLPYLAAVLNAGGGYYPLAEYIAEAKRMGIKILPPDINRSGYQFEVEGEGIRVGFLSIKGLNFKTAEKIIEERKKGAYLSLEDFLSRLPLTKAELFPLIKAGAFDPLEPQRSQQILRYFQGIEGMGGISELDPIQKREMVIEALGFDPEGDSLSLFRGKRPMLRIKDLKDCVGQEVELLVRVVDARKKVLKGGEKYFFLFEDETGLLEGVGERECLALDSTLFCLLRGVVRRDGDGRAKLFNCSFTRYSPYRGFGFPLGDFRMRESEG